MRENVEFDAGGTTLRGWFYPVSDTSSPQPAVAMAHGFSAVKEMGLARYAEVFRAAGIACLVYDNRNIGASDGLPRNEIDPLMQTNDLCSAVSYLQNRNEVDSERIGLWGTSYTGGLVINAAIADRRVKCVVSQVPYIHGRKNFEANNSLQSQTDILESLRQERLAIAGGAEPTRVSVCSYDPNEPESSPGNRTYQFFHAFDELGSFEWSNEITLRSLELRFNYDASSAIAMLSPTPLLMIVASQDEITPTAIALDAFEQALSPKQLHIIEGDHYRPYLEAFDKASSLAAEWFRRNL